MTRKIRIYRVILNILFFIFYILLFSIAFSFVFPVILISLGMDVWSVSDHRFDFVQIVIFILVLVFSLIFRKYFYLPIFDIYQTTDSFPKNIKKVKKKKQKIINNKNSKKNNSLELDIKIGKEIK